MVDWGKYMWLCCLCLLFFNRATGQVKLNGYLTEMPSYTYSGISKEGFWDNRIHNRLNLSWNPSETLSTALEIRSQFVWGQTLESIPSYVRWVGKDYGWFDGAVNWAEGHNYLVNSRIDRAWVDYSENDWQIRVGRQRVNWSMGMVWNPNDLFNTYSFFDFDYPERPGIDGIRIQYFSGYASSLEAVVKGDSENRLSAGMRYCFNKWRYDFQVLGGYFVGEEWALGVGWSGQISGAGFYGEFTSLFPGHSGDDPVYIGSMGGNYTFKNSLMLQTEWLYSSNLKDEDINFLDLYTQESTVKNMSIAEFSWFGSLSYPITPLLNGTLAGIWYPGERGWFVGPSLEYSLRDNLFLSYYGQFFSGREDAEQFFYCLNFIRLKWNF